MERRMRAHLLQLRQNVQVYVMTYRLQPKLSQEQDTHFVVVLQAWQDIAIKTSAQSPTGS